MKAISTRLSWRVIEETTWAHCVLPTLQWWFEVSFVGWAKRSVPTQSLGWHCPECGEIEFAGKEGVRYAEALGKLRLKTDAEQAAELIRIRKKLKLSQRRAAAIGGVNAFSRDGKARLVAAVVNLFRWLDKHPKGIDEITA